MWQVDPGIPILVPRRADHGHRDALWVRLREHVWADANVIEGHHDDGTPFNRSAALNTAADIAGNWDMAVIADADSLVHPTQLHAAVHTAHTTGRVVIAHSRWINIDIDETDEFLNRGMLEHRDDRTFYEHTVSSMLVVPRRVWDATNGMDETFAGWGCEDRAWIRAARILTGDPIRIHGDVYHLAHDRPTEDTQRAQSPLFLANRARLREYQAVTTPEAMARLVATNRKAPACR